MNKPLAINLLIALYKKKCKLTLMALGTLLVGKMSTIISNFLTLITCPIIFFEVCQRPGSWGRVGKTLFSTFLNGNSLFVTIMRRSRS